MAAKLAKAVRRLATSLGRRGEPPAGDDRSALVVELAQVFIGLAREAAPGFTTAYFRFAAEGLEYGSNASSATAAGVTLFDPFKHQAAFERLNELGLRLLQAAGEETGVVLLIADTTARYEVRFEHQDLARWRITKAGGGTGIPAGL